MSRPIVKIKAGELHVSLEQTLPHLGAIPNLYSMQGSLVRAVKVEESDPERKMLAAGSTILRGVTSATMMTLLSSVICFQKFDGRHKAFVDCDPPDTLVAAVLDRGEYPEVPSIRGVTHTPIMHSDGELISLGYDRKTQMLIANDVEIDVAAKPTHEDAKTALEKLAEPFGTFPFTTEAGRYIPVALALTVIHRHLTPDAVPGFAVDASMPGTGKTLAAKGSTVVATGRPAPMMTYPTKPDEMEKVLGAFALSGASIVFFDNVTCSVGGGPLDKVLTATECQLRVLGKSETPSLPWTAVIVLTGNNLVINGDTRRRLCLGRIDAQQERPELRSGFMYAGADLLNHIGEQRAEYLRAAFTLCRAWIRCGREKTVRDVGSYESWSRTIASMIRWAGGPDITTTVLSTDDSQIDDSKAWLRKLMTEWKLLQSGPKDDSLFAEHGSQGMTAKMVIDACYPPRKTDLPLPKETAGIREALEQLLHAKNGSHLTTVALGNFLRRNRDVIVGDMRFAHTIDSHTKLTLWHVETVAEAAEAAEAVSTLRAETAKTVTGDTVTTAYAADAAYADVEPGDHPFSDWVQQEGVGE